MSAPQNTIAIVYDYDQTLSPGYMQDEVVFPAFGINGESFWRRCSELVREKGLLDGQIEQDLEEPGSRDGKGVEPVPVGVELARGHGSADKPEDKAAPAAGATE